MTEQSYNNQQLIDRLYEAIDENRIEWVREQLTQQPHLINADLPVCGWLGSSVFLGLYEMTEMLIDIGCDVNVTDGFSSLLASAVSSDRPEIVRLLLERGARLRAGDRTVLTACRRERAIELLELLEQHDADIHEVFNNENTGEQINALSMAIHIGRDDVVDFLRSRGCTLRKLQSADSVGGNLMHSEGAQADAVRAKSDDTCDKAAPRVRRVARLRSDPTVGSDSRLVKRSTLRYVVFVDDVNESQSLFMGPVKHNDADYLRQAADHLQPLSDEEYMTGPAVVLHSMAKYCYVLDDDDLYWCVEWDPGLLIIKMTPGQPLSWVALRSPIPNFGGREPLPDDGDPNDFEFDDDPQYNLIFTPWDAQHETDARERDGFVPADELFEARFISALSRVNDLTSVMESRFANDPNRWFQRGKQNLKNWCGEGLRFSTSSSE